MSYELIKPDTRFDAIVFNLDTVAEDEPLRVYMVRKDGTVQAALHVAAGIRLVADADGVRVEALKGASAAELP